MRFLIKRSRGRVWLKKTGRVISLVVLAIFLLSTGVSLYVLCAVGIGEPFWGQRGNGKSKCLMTPLGTCSQSKTSISKSIIFQLNLWTRVSDSLYTYSAYLDNRTRVHDLEFPLLIRIMGILQIPPLRLMDPLRRLRIKNEIYLGDRFQCKVYYESSENGSLIELEGETHLSRSIFEEGIKVYAGSFFNCYSPSISPKTLEIFSQTKASIFVSIIPIGVTEYPRKLIPVRRLLEHEVEGTREKLAVCVRPLFGPWDDLQRTAEFMAYYSAMGVERFTFYDFGIAPKVLHYLEVLVQENIDIQVLPWNLPTGNSSELWDFGSLVALNDCVYRNYGANTGIIIVDIDEFIVPGQHGIESLKALFFLLDRKLGEVLIRNSFFCKEFCERKESKEELQIFACATRTKRVWSAKLRAKFFVNPRAIVSVGHHGVTRFVGQLDSRIQSSSNSLQLRPQHALLHHYRTCRDISSSKHPVLSRLAVPDSRMNHFKPKVKSSIPYVIWKAQF